MYMIMALMEYDMNSVSFLYQEMFDLLYGFGARLDIRNRQGLTPLTLAAKLARKDVSFKNILFLCKLIYEYLVLY